MRIRLVVTNLMLNESTNCDLSVDGKVTFGRYLGSPVTLQGDRLSRNHFCFTVENGALTVEDLSSNGTWLNGLQLKEKRPEVVKSGDIIEIPGYHMEVSMQNVSAPEPPRSDDDPVSKSREATVPSWKRAITPALQFLEPRETVLLLLALASVALITLFLNR